MSDPIKRVEKAIAELKSGKMIILVDHADRENEGDLIFPAESITPEIMTFIIRNSSGIVCLSLYESQLKKMGLDYMVAPHNNTSRCGTPFTVSIEAKKGVTTGVSAQDRVTTILTAINNSVSENDIAKPGHVFPLWAKSGGVLERAGHTEGAIDIVRFSGFSPSAVLCEVMSENGTMTKGKELLEFSEKHKLFVLSIDDLIIYRRTLENLISDDVSAELPLKKYGNLTLTVVKEKFSDVEHMILMNDKITKKNNSTLVRIHSACLTGDLLGSERCDCNAQLHFSLERISKEGGLLIYLSQEGRGIGLFNKIKAYALQENGLNTIEANEALNLPIDAREYYIAAAILRNKNIHAIRLMTNNPEKVISLKKYGLASVEMEPIPSFPTVFNKAYLTTKRDHLNHCIEL